MYKIIGADGKEYGPVAADQLRQWIAQGRANAQTRVADEGSVEWNALASLPEFASLFARAQSAPDVYTARRTHPFAVAGMIFGILAFAFCCCCCGLPFNILGIIFSIIGLVQIRANPQIYDGTSLAVAGLVLSVLSLVIGFALQLFSSGVGAWHGMIQEM